MLMPPAAATPETFVARRRKRSFDHRPMVAPPAAAKISGEMRAARSSAAGSALSPSVGVQECGSVGIRVLRIPIGSEVIDMTYGGLRIPGRLSVLLLGLLPASCSRGATRAHAGKPAASALAASPAPAAVTVLMPLPRSVAYGAGWLRVNRGVRVEWPGYRSALLPCLGEHDPGLHPAPAACRPDRHHAGASARWRTPR